MGKWRIFSSRICFYHKRNSPWKYFIDVNSSWVNCFGFCIFVCKLIQANGYTNQKCKIFHWLNWYGFALQIHKTWTFLLTLQCFALIEAVNFTMKSESNFHQVLPNNRTRLLTSASSLGLNFRFCHFLISLLKMFGNAMLL